MIFVNRETELKFLEEAYRKKGAQLVVLYGRRRVGKTELLLRFAARKEGVYFLAPRTVSADQCARFQRACVDQLRSGRAMELRAEWEILLAHAMRAGRRPVVILDELPYLIESDPSVPSLFQQAWDLELRKSNGVLILCGSSVSMMENEVLGRRSPLYGRRTAQWRVEPLSFGDLGRLFRRYDAREQVETYSVLGGIPYYWAQFEPSRSLRWNLLSCLLAKGSVLFEEARILLREELREPRVYFTILQAIAEGCRKYGHIINRTGLEKQVLSRYLGILEDLGFVAREVPATERHPAKSKRGLYEISDPYVRFWFRFVFPHEGDLERAPKDVLARRILPVFAGFVARTFETLCAQAARRLLEVGGTPDAGLRIGRWWERSEEIDVLAVSDGGRVVLAGECTWSDRVDSKAEAVRLRAKLDRAFGSRAREARLAVFARTFSRHVPEVVSIDLARLGRLLRG